MKTKSKEVKTEITASTDASKDEDKDIEAKVKRVRKCSKIHPLPPLEMGTRSLKKRTVKKHLPNQRRKNGRKGKNVDQQGKKGVVENKNVSKNQSRKGKKEHEKDKKKNKLL